jgi:hypothetical protein
MSLMKSLSMVARTEVLRRDTPGDWSIKDRTSCAENLDLGREDDIIKIMQVEGAKCIITWGPTGAKGRPNRAEMGLVWSAQPTSGVGSPPPFLAPEGLSTLTPWRSRHSRGESHSHQEAIHKLERERRDISEGRSTTSKEEPTSGEEGRYRRKGDHDQRCYAWHLDGVISLFIHGL